MPTVLIIAGPNGAGKTTFATRWIAENAPAVAFVNADEVARELNDPALSLAERDLKAGRLMLARLADLIEAGNGDTHSFPRADLGRAAGLHP